MMHPVKALIGETWQDFRRRRRRTQCKENIRYSEMRLANLGATGQAMKEAGVV